MVSYLKYDGNFLKNLFSLKDIPSIYLTSTIFILSFLFNKLYSFKTYLFWDEMRNIVKASFFSLVLLLLFSFINKTYYSRFVVIYGITLFVILDMVIRYFYRKVLYKLNIFKTNVLIIGAGEMGKIISDKIKAHTFTTYNIIGFLDDDETKVGKKINDYKILGKTEDIDKILSQNDIDEVIIAIPTANRQTISQIISHLEGKVRRIKFIPDMYGLITFSTDIQDFDGVMTISASQGLLNPVNKVLKRTFDIIFGIVGLLIFLPLFLIIGWKIKREDGGSILFKHNRVGKDLKEFKMYKFRTMVPNAEQKLKEMLEKDEKLREEFYKNFKLKDDPRITKIGKFLRKTSLDEFPQFLNVIKGDMSIVGPRPVVRKEIEMYYGEEVAKRVFAVKPGITGMWQANGRSDVEDYDERIALDLYYIRNWSLWLDIIIILKTIKAVLDRKGAY
ncbi:hypothetical protein XO11_05860 [Marinitoga sp. 1138]|nr:hypothetical protein [Marinitoga sp. 1138]